MKIHLHANTFNEMTRLDFFFRHYGDIVETFFFYDDGSDDGTLEYLGSRSDVVLEPKPQSDPNSYVQSSRDNLESCWHRSRGEADWVIVTDVDEHLYHPRLCAHLEEQQRAGVTAIPALGYQMLTDTFPAPSSHLCRDHLRGAPWAKMSKLALFQPDHITATNFTIGRHEAAPEGGVTYPQRDEVLNLHYKYLGLEYILARHALAQSRRRASDLARGWGHRYALGPAEIEADYAAFAARAVDVTAGAPHDDHREPRWWRAAPRPRPTADTTAAPVAKRRLPGQRRSMGKVSGST